MTARSGKYLPQLERRVDRSIFTEIESIPPKTGDIHCTVPESSSPSSDRVKNIRESPNWRNKEVNFVRRTGNHGEDPFVSSVSAGQPQGQDLHHSLIEFNELTVQGNKTSFSPRRDRTGVPLSNDNAQAILPPRACVFVAK